MIEISENFNPLQVDLEPFQGPLDLLLQLIQKKKLDINSIPLSNLCQPFLEYVKAVKRLNLENASQFIYIAARLVAIKSRSLLPTNSNLIDDSEDIDLEEELREQLKEYQRIKIASNIINEMDWLQRDSYPRAVASEIQTETELLFELNIPDLVTAYKSFLFQDEALKPEFQITEIKLDSKILLENIVNHFQEVKSFTVGKLFNLFISLEEKALAFLLLLEICRLKWIDLEQINYLEEIHCYPNEKFSLSAYKDLDF